MAAKHHQKSPVELPPLILEDTYASTMDGCTVEGNQTNNILSKMMVVKIVEKPFREILLLALEL